MINPQAGILKKLDRVMVSDKFIEEFDKSSATYLPNIVYDRCPAVLSLPSNIVRKPKPFRFSNHVVDKPEFIEIVKEEWNKGGDSDNPRHIMSKLKRMKYSMKQLSWKKGDVFERDNKLKVELKRIQQLISMKPFDNELGEQVAKTLKEYKEVVDEEEKLLYQKAKVEWLQDGDRNSAFFPKVIKGRMHRNRVVSVCDDILRKKWLHYL